MQAKRQYSEEFKKEAIHLLETSGKRLSEIERDLGWQYPKIMECVVLLS